MAQNRTKVTMRNVVIDASILASLMLNETEFRHERDTIFTYISNEDTSVYVPPHFLIEMGNVLLSAMRQKRIPKDRLAEHLLYIQNFPLTEHSSPLYRVASLALKHGLSMYDAALLSG